MTESYLSIEDVISLPGVSAPVVSPDARWVAFVRTDADWEHNRFRERVWLADVGTGRTYPVTGRGRTSAGPRFAPGSDRLSYLARSRGDSNQVFVHVLGEAVSEQVTHSEQSVQAHEWLPGGAGIVYTAAAPEPKGLTARDEAYGSYEHVDVEYERICLWRLDVEAGLLRSTRAQMRPADLRGPKAGDPAEQLTAADAFSVLQFALSPDGARAALVVTPTPDLADLDERTIVLLDLATGSVEALEACGKPAWGPLFSPDSGRLAYHRPSGDGRWFENAVVELLDLDDRTAVRLADLPDESVTATSFTQRGLVCSWIQGTVMGSSLVALDGGAEPLPRRDPDAAEWSTSATPDGAHIAGVSCTPGRLPEVVLDGRTLTDVSEAIAGRRRSRRTAVRWTSLDGTPVEGVLSLAPDGPEGPRPLLVVLHGGPISAALLAAPPARFYPIESFVERGFAVLEPNYRGSAGYGEDFRSRNYRDLGLGDYADVVSGVDAMAASGVSDGGNVGVMGWSQGGYIAAFCATYGAGRFRAVSVGAGISNWVTYYVNTDIHPFTRHYLGATPWEDPEVYARTSPITYVAQASTPTLIQHGSDDARVPLPNAYELHQGLRDNGVHTELVVFDGMGHVPAGPGQMRAIARQNYMWFCHHLLGDPLDGFRLDRAGEATGQET